MLSADTIVPNYANPQSFNRYSYVNNNPIRFNDPTGHCGADQAQKQIDQCIEERNKLEGYLGNSFEGTWSLVQGPFLANVSPSITFSKKSSQKSLVEAHFGDDYAMCEKPKFSALVSHLKNTFVLRLRRVRKLNAKNKVQKVGL